MSQEQRPDQHEEGVDVPYDRLNPETLLNLVKEFVTRQWEEVGESDFTLDDKVAQVFQQLKDSKAKVVFDLASETGNIVVCR
jgi:uncharacterized protein YheU (UPF0270 family)